MTFNEAVIYGVVQGLTELLPVSSSAHLAITHWLLGTTNPESDLAFDVALHIGTLIPVVLYFWRDWFDLIKAFFMNLGNGQLFKNPDSKLFCQLVVVTIPGGLFGLLFEKKLAILHEEYLLIASAMIILGAILWAADVKGKGSKTITHINWLDTIIVGISQAFALIPGVSRSGITMTTGLLCQFDRVTAVRFSFLMSAPIILGAAVHELPHLIRHGIETDILVGILTAAVVGWGAIAGLMRYIQKNSFLPFVIYRFIFGIVVFALVFIRH